MKINRNLIQLNLMLFPNSLKKKNWKEIGLLGIQVFSIIELREWPVGKNNLMNWKNEGGKKWHLRCLNTNWQEEHENDVKRLLAKQKQKEFVKYIPHTNSRFFRSLNKWIWCGFQSKAKIEPRYSTAKSNVSHKENPARTCLPFSIPRSASFKIYFPCKFTCCPFNNGEKTF